MEQRNYCFDDTLVKVGIDGGQGFFKICLNLVSRNNAAQSSKAADSGIKGFFIACIVPNMQESFVNAMSKIVWKKFPYYRMELILFSPLILKWQTFCAVFSPMELHTPVVIVKLPMDYGKLLPFEHWKTSNAIMKIGRRMGRNYRKHGIQELC